MSDFNVDEISDTSTPYSVHPSSFNIPDIEQTSQRENIELVHNEESLNDLVEIAISRSLLDLDDTEVHFGRVDHILDNDDTLPLDDILPTQIKLHRGHIFEELNNAVQTGFISLSTSALEVSMVLPNGAVEQGEDSGGVLRDCITEYFETFYDKCTKGNNIRIPVVRHDMRYTWENVAKIIVLSYKLVGYFPIELP